MDEKNLSKPGPKQKLFDSTKYVFSEVEMTSGNSGVWNHFLKDKKHNAAKCKSCDNILKADNGTSSLIRHLKNTHKIELKSVEPLDEPANKKGKLESFFQPKAKPIQLQEMVAKMTSVDGFTFSALAKSETLEYVFQKAGYKLYKSHSDLRNLAMDQYESIKNKIKSEIAEAKQSGM